MHSVIEVTVPAKQAQAFEDGVAALLHERAPGKFSRAGSPVKVTILRGAHTKTVNRFLLIAEVTGPVGLLHLLGETPFEAFGAKVKDRGDYGAVGEWLPNAT
jgi:hypothetical protein